jgi:hypothetical protein
MDGLAAALDGTSGFSPVPFVRIDGGTDGEGRREAAARFRADPRVRVALLSVTAAGVGLDFSCASVVVFAGERCGVMHVFSPASLLLAHQAESTCGCLPTCRGYSKRGCLRRALCMQECRAGACL